MRLTSLIGGFAVLAVFSVRATNANADWSNGAANNVFSNAANWAGNTIPNTGYSGTGDFIRIDLAGANKSVYGATLNNPGTGATSAQAGIFSRLQIADTSGNGELDVTNGYFDTDSTSASVVGSSGRTGTLVVSGGATTVSLGGWLFVGNSTGGTGVVNVINGSFSSSRDNPVGSISHVSIVLGNGNSASGTLTMSGGSVATRSGMVLGGPGTSGLGRFAVLGGGAASIGTIGSAAYGFWVQNSGSTLAAYVTNGTLGQIYVANLAGKIAGTYDDGNVIFMPGSKLELGFLGATNAGAWDLMKFDGALLTNGLSLVSGTDTNWSFQFVTNGSQTVLRVTYIAANLSAPTNIVAYPGNAQAAVRWAVASGATNYLLLRGTNAGGPYPVTNSIPAPASAPFSTLSFTDTGLSNGVTYYYVVSAAMTNGETANSFEVRATPYGGTFVHPGVVHTIGDLERMRTNIIAGNYPWYMGYTNLLADSHSTSAYTMEGPMTTIYRDAITGTLPTAFQDDCGAAYQNALLWYLTGDPAHATKAIQILDAWSATCTSATGSDTRLACGLQGYKFITAAELIRNTGAPWSQAEINTCSNFIRTVLLPQNRMYGGGNWGQIGACSAMAAGVFMDDEAVFNEAYNCFLYGAPTECDMGINTYINPLGWTDEADRDVGHWGLALDNITEASWIAWCQGLDMWTYLNNRTLAAHEYLAYFNLNNNTNNGYAGLTNLLAPYVAGSQCDGPANGGLITGGGGLASFGEWNPLWEQAYNPYHNLVGLAAPWTSNAVNQVRPEGYDRDHIAFGTLVAALPTRTPGLPLLPSGLTATWSNAQVRLVWNAASNAAAYFVKRATARGGPYTNIAIAIMATNFTDTTVANDTWYFYKVSATNAAGETANSGLARAYPSAAVPAAPAGLTAKATSQVRIDLAWNAVPGATSYTIQRANVSGAPYTTMASGQGTIFQIYADTGLTPGTTYYYVITASNNMGASLVSTQAGATTLPALPAAWNYADAGYLTTPGHATYDNQGTFTVLGAGLDMGSIYTADAFGFAYVPLTGDGMITARMVSQSMYSGLDKTGLVMRDDLSNGSRNAQVQIDGAGAVTMVYRSTANSTGGSTSAVGNTVTLPQWLRLTRTNGVFNTYLSPDGMNWTLVGTKSMTLSNTVYAGFAVCSRNNGYLDTATFDNVSVTGAWPEPPGVPIGLAAAPGDARATLAWSTATNATGYNVKRGNSGSGPFSLVATNFSGMVFTNTGLVNGVQYYYVVSGTNIFGESGNSAAVAVRPVSLASPSLNVSAVLAASQMQFNWPTDHVGWELQAQTNPVSMGMGTNWITVAGSGNTNTWTIPVSSTNGAVFYRLTYP